MGSMCLLTDVDKSVDVTDLDIHVTLSQDVEVSPTLRHTAVLLEDRGTNAIRSSG
jgi:hypothetical protein